MGSFDCWSYVPTGTGRWGSTDSPGTRTAASLPVFQGKDEEAAINDFVADLISGKSIIALKRIGGSVADAWVTDDPADDVLSSQQYGPGDETMEFRRWDGSSVEV
ncbi:hypothetical protein HAP41_0000042835 [Bradyrhizobium barranii subsp. apii]|uniref:Uncharacterized protein n=1 Tax=Bradyrhizobium barranii subsp. apii TaxID=2819348 RepID=A0A8T5UYJ1_9BRAD|nr:hypothetical protein [Bradyrhizobium barranii]UPT86890.1 hypothetical protein HAP41_0000042835 [Bradyrhizobium barranii subsp. apii]UPT97599.1 hypothetical protein J4G48_0005590 [Bradyrhizobium barranii subsp. apii]